MAAKAVSSSSSLAALSTSMRRPSACAAAWRFLVSGSAFGLFGLTRSASAFAFGTVSLRTSRRLAARRFMKLLSPVTLPPGRLILLKIKRLDETHFDRVLADDEHDRDFGGRSFRC